MTELLSAQAWGDNANLYTLRNVHDMRVQICDIGASLVSWYAPDRAGRMADILLGCADAAAYQHHNPAYFGVQVGRWANRIRDGRFQLDGVDYQLERNQGGVHHLHGGSSGFHQRRWQMRMDGDALRCSLLSPDGEGGFPGALQLEVVYTLHDDGTLRMDYQAQSDAATPLNLTAHPYFNLNGGEADIGDHLLAIDADGYLQVDAGLVATQHSAVAGSPFDFRQPAPIGARLAWPDAQLAMAGGFDHCFCLNGEAGTLRTVAQVLDPASGRQLTVATTEPGLQFYSGNALAGVAGRRNYTTHSGFCLEAQHYPDQINMPEAEAVILRPGKVYRQTTCYRIDVNY